MRKHPWGRERRWPGRLGGRSGGYGGSKRREHLERSGYHPPEGRGDDPLRRDRQQARARRTGTGPVARQGEGSGLVLEGPSVPVSHLLDVQERLEHLAPAAHDQSRQEPPHDQQHTDPAVPRASADARPWRDDGRRSGRWRPGEPRLGSFGCRTTAPPGTDLFHFTGVEFPVSGEKPSAEPAHPLRDGRSWSARSSLANQLH